MQIAFAALVTDRAIKGVVDQEKLHHPFAGFFDHGRVCLDHRGLAFGAGTQVLDLHRAGRSGLGRATNHLDQAHAAVACDGEAFVIAEARDFNTCRFAGLNERHGARHLDFLTVDNDFLKIGHGQPIVPVPRLSDPGGRCGREGSNAAGPVMPVGSHLQHAENSPVWATNP